MRRIVLKPSHKNISKIAIEKANKKDMLEEYGIKEPLYWILEESYDTGLLVDLKLMQNLARTLDSIIKTHSRKQESMDK